MPGWNKALPWAAGLAVMLVPLVVASPAQSETAEASSWCAPEFEQLKAGVCAQTHGDQHSDVLVIFLHGVIKPDSSWQHQQQRAIARGASANGFDVIMPRGRRGIGPQGMQDWWTWPTSAKAQAAVGAELLEEWRTVRQILEDRRGKPYAQVLIFGFSNGAYYASELALSGNMPASGCALFAGGAGGAWLERLGKQARHRSPIYLEVGMRDRQALEDGRRLRRLLERLSWPHRFVERERTGHSMTDRGVKQAFEYLTHPSVE